MRRPIHCSREQELKGQHIVDENAKGVVANYDVEFGLFGKWVRREKVDKDLVETPRHNGAPRRTAGTAICWREGECRH